METALSAPLVQRERAGEEGSLLSAARQGEPWALERLFHAYQPDIYRLCHRMLGRAEDAQDATQTTFIRAFRDLSRFRGDSALRTWLYRIAVNESVSQLRRRKDVQTLEEAGEPSHDSSRGMLERVAVAATLSRVSEAHRAILVLRFWEGLSYEELAQVLGISLPAAKMRLHRAREEFRRAYEAG